MTIVAVLPLVPHPPDQGDRLRAWEMVTALAGRGALTLCIVSPGPVAAGSLDALRRLPAEVHVFPLGLGQRLLGAAAGLLRGRPPSITAFWNRSLQVRVSAVAPAGGWDLACAFQFRAAPYVQSLPARIRVLELTDALGLYRRQLPWRGRAGTQRAALRGIEGLERTLPLAFDELWISAADDADWIERLCGRRPRVVPNGCTPLAEPAPYRPDGPVLFLGNMRYPPNEDAVLWFAREVWPRARAAGPQRLRLVGRTTRAVRALARRPGIEVPGWVPDVGAELAAASVVINPVRFGTGTNRKVLDAWAAARPVVSTPIGVRGFACVAGRHVLLADSAAAWGERMEWVHGHPEAAREVGLQGWAFAREAADTRGAWAAAVEDVVGSADASDGCDGSSHPNGPRPLRWRRPIRNARWP